VNALTEELKVLIIGDGDYSFKKAMGSLLYATRCRAWAGQVHHCPFIFVSCFLVVMIDATICGVAR
jgi:hypothetical protein